MIIESSTDPAPTRDTPARKRAERRALGVFAILALAIMAWVAKPVGVGIFIGALTAFMIQPLYALLGRRFKRPWVAQVLSLAIATLVVLGIVAGVVAVFVSRGTVMGSDLLSALEPGGKLRDYLGVLNEKLSPLGIHTDKIADKLREAASSIAAYAASVATTIAGQTFHAILTFFFVLLTANHVLASGKELDAFMEDISPLSRQHTRSLIAEMRKVGKATLLGSVVTGLAQGLLAYGVFAVTRLPEALFFGVATAVASLLPGVGTMLVWVPAGAYLIASGHVGMGILELVASTLLVIGFCDYVLRPRLIGGESMPTLLTFAALFGGLEAFGLVGLLMGPLLMSVAVAVLRLYRDDLKSGELGPKSTEL
ncbi:MAG: AI-2E family transporter [Polyangia bacterium]